MTDEIAVLDPAPVRREGIASVLAPLGVHVRAGDLDTPGGCPPADAIVLAGGEPELAAICRVLRAHATTPSLALLESACLAEDRVRAVLHAGADGVLPANVDPETLVAGLRLVREGSAVLPRGAVALGDDAPPAECRPALEPQQIVWLQRLADGGTVAELAEEMAYSERAMYRLLDQLYGVLGTRQRSRALVLAARLGLVR